MCPLLFNLFLSSKFSFWSWLLPKFRNEVWSWNVIKIASSKYQNYCPDHCPFQENVTKLYDCNYYRESFGLLEYPKKKFELLENLEKELNCSGICSNQSLIRCKYFYNMSIPNSKNCSYVLYLLAIKYFYYLYYIFLILINVIAYHISSLINLIHSKDYYKGINRDIPVNPDLNQIVAEEGKNDLKINEVKDTQSNDAETHRSLRNINSLDSNSPNKNGELSEDRNISGIDKNNEISKKNN